MRIVGLFEKCIHRGDYVSTQTFKGYTDYPRDQHVWTYGDNWRRYVLPHIYLEAGTYTLTVETEKNLTAKIYSFKNGEAAGKIPADGAECELPFTFTIGEALELSVDLAVAGWDGQHNIDDDDIAEVRVHNTASEMTEDIFETVVLRPDEISDEDVITKAANSKSNISVNILPTFELWGFCERSVTYAQFLDLDKPSGERTIFRGRVAAVANDLDSSGKLSQTVICASMLECLEDTMSKTDTTSGAELQAWFDAAFATRNRTIGYDARRTLSAEVTGTFYISGLGKWYKSLYEQITVLLTSGKCLSTRSGTYSVAYQKALEFREKYSNGENIIEVAPSFGIDKDTPIIIGENLKELKIERNVDDGIYTSVMVRSGVNSDGTRYQETVSNNEMVAKYGVGRIKLITNDDIRCTGAMYEDTYQSGAWYNMQTAENLNMQSKIRSCAVAEAKKLSDPPTKITLTAEDLAALGYTGYEPFELYNSHPVVCPAFGLHGQMMKITFIKRRLSDGRIEQIVVESGEKLLNESVGAKPLSEIVSKVEVIETRIDDNAAVNAEIAETKANEQNDGVKIKYVTPEEFEHTVIVPSYMYVVHKADGTNDFYIGSSHISSGGGGGTLEYGAVLDGEEGTGWIPSAEPVPVSFAGDTSVYYGQPRARAVIQGYRALFGGVAPEAADLMSEITLTTLSGVTRTYKAIVSGVSFSSGSVSISVSVQIYEGGVLVSTVAGSGWSATNASTIQIGMYITSSGWALRDGALYPTNVKIYGAMALDGGTVRTSTSSIDIGTPTVSEAERGFGTAITSRAQPS